MNYFDFSDAIRFRESTDNYTAINQFGFIGGYQMGEMALIDAGYYTNEKRGQIYFLA